jgi:hypothetical protein
MAKKKKNRKKLGWQAILFLILSLLMAIVFLPTTAMLCVGMLPTVVCGLVDKTKGMVRTMSVGSMNLAGCVPFIIELWAKGHSFEVTFEYLIQPRTIIVMYFSAAMGYLIDWAMTGIVCAIMVEKAKGRIKDIEKQHLALMERWGEEVNGKIPLDPEGFPLEPQVLEVQKA